MIAPSIQEIATTELVTETTIDPDLVAVRAIGSVDSPILADLRTYLGSLHRVAQEARTPQIQFDLRGLDFVSAAGFRILVEWLQDVGCATSFVLHEKKPWQRRSIAPIVEFSGDRVSIDTR